MRRAACRTSASSAACRPSERSARSARWYARSRRSAPAAPPPGSPARDQMSADEPAAARGLLRDRDAVVLIDRKQRSYLRTLRPGRVLTVRGNAVPCDELIGRPEGTVLTTARGERLLVLRPTYAQLIPSLPRQAQPIYPKDVAPEQQRADVAAGMRVIEVGVGPGALTLA